ncbi:MAG: VWA domain-containing protein [Candidatus Ancillula sp.]|nr:VWA domain-containing protein [Candidatus Ancillula sp.]
MDIFNVFTFQPVIPWWLAVIILVPLAGLCIRQIIVVDSKKYDSNKFVWVRRLLTIALMAIISFGPTIISNTENYSLTNLDYLFVVDKTGSMSAIDGDTIGTTRLDIAKQDIVNLTNILPAGKYSAISFDSVATEDVPLTSDSRAIKTWAKTLNPEISAYSEGTDLLTPRDLMIKTIDNIRAKNHNDQVIVFYISDGEDNSGTDLSDYNELNDLVSGGAVLGYGTQKGAKMKEYIPNTANSVQSREDLYIQDPTTNQDAISKLNEDNLNKIASLMKIDYKLSNSSQSIVDVGNKIYSKNWSSEPVLQNQKTYNLIVWPFAEVLAFLILWEMVSQLLLHFTNGESRKK